MMTKPIYILNGPNLNLLGQREPEIYGKDTLEDIEKRLTKLASSLELKLSFRQTNSEGELINWVQEARHSGRAIIMNAAGLTHTSIALLDALNASELPVIEVHLSNIFRRENFRHHSYVSKGAIGVICGFGAMSYELALHALINHLKKKD